MQCVCVVKKSYFLLIWKTKPQKTPLFWALFLASVYTFLTCHVFADEYKISKQIYMANTDDCIV